VEIRHLLSFSLLLLFCHSAAAHAPDDAYLKELTRRLPKGDGNILSAVVKAFNEHDKGFFDFFCDEDAMSNLNSIVSEMKSGAQFGVVSDTHQQFGDYEGHGYTYHESVIVSELKNKKIIALDRLTISWTDPDGWLYIRSIHLQPAGGSEPED
jgi:hypothetical protein